MALLLAAARRGGGAALLGAATSRVLLARSLTASARRAAAQEALAAVDAPAADAGRQREAEERSASGVAAEGASQQEEAARPTPGECDALNFQEGPSVAFWRTWEPPSVEPRASSLAAAAAGALATAASEARDAQSASYWAYHLARTAFFAAQGTAGLLAAGTLRHPVTGAVPPLSAALRLLAEALATYSQDLQHIRAGLYPLPWDMSLRHRQFSPRFIAERGARFLAEAAATLRRRDAGAPEPLWLQSRLYPDYYLHSWHYQSDGWLSPASAAVYETSTETLFIGRQDAMQRAGLSLLCRHLREQCGDATSAVDGEHAPRILDVGAGTGRFLTFVRDAFPAAHVTAAELSPFYLAEAREGHAHWEELRGGDGATGSAAFVQAAAEALPFPDASFDAVTSVYLFHELPPAARAAAAAEMARVLRPGGVCVLTDSVQLGDRPRLDAGLGRFGDFNEPNYRSYIETDLGALLAEVGLVPQRKEVSSTTKALSFVKPARQAGA